MAKSEDSREKRLAYMRRWRAANAEKMRAYHRAWYAANTESIKAGRVAKAATKSEESKHEKLAKRREKMRAWRAENPESYRAEKQKWSAANPEKHREVQRKALKKWQADNPMPAAYYKHKSRAERRGVEFLLTLEEWTTIWVESGKWDQRRNGADGYCMARHGDTGPYAVGNVRICTNRQNNAEQSLYLREETRKKRSDAMKAHWASVRSRHDPSLL